MNINLTLKCGLYDSFFFIKQISSLNIVKKIVVFRDEKSLHLEKVKYVVSIKLFSSKINLILRFIMMVLSVDCKPDVIIGIYEIPHGLLAMLAGKVLKVPSIVSIIGNPAYSKLRRGLRLWLTIWILKQCSYITVTGNNSRQFLIKKGLTGEKIFVLPNTIDFTHFRNMELEKQYDIVSLGRLSEEKHVEIIIEIVAKLKKEIPNIKAAIGGSGPAKNELISIVKKLNLEKNIEICGFIPDEDLTSFFNKGKIFVLTSETEGFPRTIIQAAACGLPVVASNVGDMIDVIEHNKNGFLVNNYNNVNEFSERILQLMNDESLYKRFSIELDKKVRDQFITEKASKIWQEIFEKIEGK